MLDGDAQQNNFISITAGAVRTDVAAYFGHPELDLALVDYFEPVPVRLFDAYRNVLPIDAGPVERRELWRLAGYLAVVDVGGNQPFRQKMLGRLTTALQTYR